MIILSIMITIFSPTDFDFNIGAYQRIRATVARRIDPSRFRTIGFSSRPGWPPNVEVIDPNMPRKGLWRLLPQQRIMNKINSARFGSGLMGIAKSFALPETNFISMETWKARTTTFELVARASGARADIYHSVARPECVWIWNVLKLRNPDIRQIITFYGYFNQEPWRRCARILTAGAKIATAVSRTTAKEVQDDLGVECRVIHDGVDTDLYRPRNHFNERKRILYVGSLQKRKRPDFVVKMAREYSNCDFTIHGGGDLYTELKHMARGLENFTIQDRKLSFDELSQLYSSADIFLFPSIHEGFSNVMLEAAASGVPMICSNATSFPEFVEEGKNGFLCDTFEQMVARLRYLIENDASRIEMGRLAREKALEFDWSRVVPEYEKLFEDVFNM